MNLGLHRILPLILAAPVLTIGAVAQTPPRFDTSTLTASPTSIHPLETIDYTLTIRNSGGSAPSYLRIANAIPTSAMFVSASPEWKFIEAERELSWMGTLPPGASKVLTFSLVTRPESAGLMLANRAAIHFDGAYHAVDLDLEIASPPGQRGLTTAGLLVAGYLAIALIVFAVFRRRGRMIYNGGLALIVIASGFLLIFVDIARRDANVQSRFAETQCTVLDSMARYAESRSASTQRRPSGTWSPLFALRYATPSGETVSIGYATESRLQFGSSRPTEAALASLPRGAVAPCWYDPDDPKRIVLVRSPGGAYAFALIPLAALALGVWLMRGKRRRLAG